MENCGQILNTSGEPNSEVHFLWSSPVGLNVQARSKGLSFDVWQRKSDDTYLFHRLDLNFSGGNDNPEITGARKLAGVINDYRSGRNASNIAAFSEILYRDIYPEIDFRVVLTEDARSFKYDFILHEGAEIGDIRLEYAGFDCFSQDGDDLVFELSGKTIREEIPMSWLSESGQPINVRYKIIHTAADKVLIGFETADSETAGKPMVIDPLAKLEWSTYYGDSLYDIGNAISTDTLGNIFIAGTTESPDAIASAGSHISEYAGGTSDAFLVKFNQHGLRHWATYYGGSAADKGLGVDVDHDHVYLVGSSGSMDLLNLAENDTAYQVTKSGGFDGFIAKFDRLGILKWETYLGGYGNDELTHVHSKNGQTVVVMGNSSSTNVFNPAHVEISGDHSGGTDIILADFTPEGQIGYAGYFGGAGDETAAGIKIAQLGQYLIGGTTSSAENIAALEAFQTELSGASDGFVTLLDSLYDPVWSTYLGGTGSDRINDMATDAETNFIYLSGTTDAETSFIDTLSSQPEFGGMTDAFAAKMSFDGLLNWYTYAGGTETDEGVSVDVDIDGSVYMLGYTFSEESIVFYDEDSVFTEYQGGGDAFVIKYDQVGTREWSYYYGGDGEDMPRNMDVFGRTGVFFTGSTTTLDSIGLAEGLESTIHQELYGGGMADGFAARITGTKSTPPPNICCNCDPWNGGGSGGGGGGNGGSGGNGPQPVGICLGDSMRLSAGAGCLGIGSEWVWYVDSCGGTDNYIGDGEEITVSPTELTTYFVRAEGIDELGSCAHVTVHVDLPIEVTATEPDTVCPGESLEFSATGATTYEWSGPGEFITDGNTVIIDSTTYENEGIYIVEGSSTFGCTDTDSVEVTLLPGPQFSVTSIDPTCIGDTDGSISVASSDTTITSFAWPGTGLDTTYRDSLGDGEYYLLVTNSYECQAGQNIILNEPVWPIDSLITTPDTCSRHDGTAFLHITGEIADFEITWSFGTDANELFVNNLDSGYYSVSLVDTNGCQYGADFSISPYGQFSAIIPEDSIFLEILTTSMIEVFTYPELENATYHWQPESGLSCSDCASPVADPSVSTWYSVLVTSPLGCSDSDSIFVERELPPPHSFIPTVFSPNGDGLNDELCVLGARITSFSFNIFNRWGEKVFSTQKSDECWDGTFKGRPVTGTVMYTLEATLEEDKSVSETGNINLLR